VHSGQNSDSTIVQIVLSLGLGGLESMAVDLAIDLNRCGLSARVIALDEGGLLETRLREAGVGYDVLNGRRFSEPNFHLSLAARLRRMRAGIIHTHGFAPLLHTLPASRLGGVWHVVHTEHSFEYLEPRASLRRALKWLSRTTRVFALCGERMLPFYQTRIGVSPQRLQVIPNGIDVDKYRPGVNRAAIRVELGVPVNAFVVGSAGRLAPEKNYGMLLAAVADSRASGVPVHVVLFGEGDDRRELERLTANLGIQASVSFVGWRTDLHRVLPALDVFALTSLSEGLPLAVLEAMACGLPIISTAVGDIPVVVEHERAGYLVPSGDVGALAARVSELARAPDRRRALGAHGRRVVADRYSRSSMMTRYLTAYGR
jgi:glycosyltransferase involved in cell wall biosynthesis